MTDRPKKKSRRRLILGFAFGLVLGVGCYWVPPEYQNLCDLASRLIGACTGGV